jgi:hypothetical protein
MRFETTHGSYYVSPGFPLGTLVGIVVLAAIVLLFIRWNKSR